MLRRLRLSWHLGAVTTETLASPTSIPAAAAAAGCCASADWKFEQRQSIRMYVSHLHKRPAFVKSARGTCVDEVERAPSTLRRVLFTAQMPKQAVVRPALVPGVCGVWCGGGAGKRGLVGS